ncbi:hypothetical protein L3X38_004666 [Prunus dulcis]|uniref:Uncharacterized protein n=1 Tax=Prunus dulcis TaxID=3755 RepID=A0AAD4ZPC4_PRUDU|nr:hypothetical protein L3X38_004666 [Prunus dulcis]
MHNEILSSMHLHNGMARRSNKTVVEETQFLNARSSASVANLGFRLLARNQECSSWTAQVTSLKAEVAELQKLVKQSNRKNQDSAEVVQVLQTRVKTQKTSFQEMELVGFFKSGITAPSGSRDKEEEEENEGIPERFLKLLLLLA